jgi:hypothetical protein
MENVIILSTVIQPNFRYINLDFPPFTTTWEVTSISEIENLKKRISANYDNNTCVVFTTYTIAEFKELSLTDIVTMPKMMYKEGLI